MLAQAEDLKEQIDAKQVEVYHLARDLGQLMDQAAAMDLTLSAVGPLDDLTQLSMPPVANIPSAALPPIA